MEMNPGLSKAIAVGAADDNVTMKPCNEKSVPVNLPNDSGLMCMQGFRGPKSLVHMSLMHGG